MADLIVCKFGGSSVADAGQIKKVRNIVQADAHRKMVVVSAPGRSEPSEQKVTDHLINIATDGAHFNERRITLTPAQSKQAVLTKFSGIINDLGIEPGDILRSLEQDLACPLTDERRIAFLASRGEHYNASIIAKYFNRSGMDARVMLPEDFRLLVTDDFLNASLLDEAYTNIKQLATYQRITVVPGFYGVTQGGEVAIFSRGGSDLTGGEIAYAVAANAYENWTDVSGVFEADPRLIRGRSLVVCARRPVVPC